MSIKYPASTSDCLAFESSQLYHDLDNGLLADGLYIFGDNAYINSPFVAMPYPNVSGGYKDAYNFFHSQLQIRVECAFGMFVQRWGALRSALPCGISIQKTISLVVALAKIHNFCIDQADTSILPATSVDECRLLVQTGRFVPLDLLGADNNEMADDNTTVPTQLLGLVSILMMCQKKYNKYFGGDTMVYDYQESVSQRTSFRKTIINGHNQEEQNSYCTTTKRASCRGHCSGKRLLAIPTKNIRQ
jgi:hypothetical protein